MPLQLLQAGLLFYAMLLMISEIQMENVNQKNKNKENSLLEHQPKVSIQDAFKKFQKEKFYQLKLNKYLKNIQIDRKSPEFKNELREKFMQTAHKYIGVPYNKKFHSEGDALYDAPLFLDCCGLIKQIVFDLRQEFGYTLGKWNQSYQFDLLPDEGLKESDLKAGDLIFYSATYNNPKLKPFPHKMVHVQIYLGQGKSIGARWQKGTIQVFNSYKFQSTLYHHIQVHYRSIDSWLQGKFQTHCLEHKWVDDRANEWLSDKFSVFADPSLDDINLKQSQKKDIKSIMIGKGNNCKLIHNYFSDQSLFCIMTEKQIFSPHFYFKWVQSTGEIDFYSFKEGKQLVNHIPNICIISSKLWLLKTLKELEIETAHNKEEMLMKLDEFLPKTYRLDVMSDEIEFMNDDSSGLWIYKPRNLNQGRGIKMIADIKQFKKEFINSKKFYLGEFSLNNMIHYKPELNPTLSSNQDSSSQSSSQGENKYMELKHDGLIQHYIRPLLLNGKKFDIRCFMMLNSKPSLVLFHEGYLRLTIEDYSEEDIEDQSKLMVHLTNNCFQNKHKLYKERKEDTISTWQLLRDTVGDQSANVIRQQIKKILLTVFTAAKRKLVCKKGTYELLGCDIIVSQSLKPYLLEVNTNPAMFTETKTQKEMLPKLMKNTLDIALSLFEKENAEQIAASPSTYGFDLLYCQAQTKKEAEQEVSSNL